MSDLIIKQLTKQFGATCAVDNLSLTVANGTLVSLLGPSGCGKSTILNCIAGLEIPDGGSICVGDFVMADTARNILLAPERRGLGMVFQSYALWPHMTVRDNLRFVLKLRKITGKQAGRRIKEALDLVELGNYAQRYPYQLSGGQQQRVALARAVVTEPRLLLLDEPLSNLDARVRESARTWIRELQQRVGITTIYVTHDQAEALAMSDQIAVLSNGTLHQFATPQEIYEHPASRFVASFVGATSLLRGTLIEKNGDCVRVRLDEIGVLNLRASRSSNSHFTDWTPGKTVTVAIRSERVQVVHDAESRENTFDTQVATSSYQGARWEHVVKTAAGSLRLETLDAASDHHLRLYLPPESLLLVPDE